MFLGGGARWSWCGIKGDGTLRGRLRHPFGRVLREVAIVVALVGAQRHIEAQPAAFHGLGDAPVVAAGRYQSKPRGPQAPRSAIRKQLD